MKVKTYIIASIAVSLMERVMILVIMYVKTFKTDDMVFIGNIICLTSHLLIHFVISIRVSPLICTISLCEIKGKMLKLMMICFTVLPSNWPGVYINCWIWPILLSIYNRCEHKKMYRQSLMLYYHASFLCEHVKI